jgi:Beta-lactamase
MGIQPTGHRVYPSSAPASGSSSGLALGGGPQGAIHANHPVDRLCQCDEHTIFQLALVTKSLTGAAAASVVDEGKLDWDTPIVHYVPEFVGYNPYMTRWLSTRDLLAMRTG